VYIYLMISKTKPTKIKVNSKPNCVAPLSRGCLFYNLGWQLKWDAADTGRFAHSILPKISLRPWFDGLAEDRKFVSTVSRIMSGHCTARSHLSRFGIVEGAICICLKNYETVDHLLWCCERFEAERRRLTDAFTALDVQRGTPVRDLCALKKWRPMKCCMDFL
jgi:hypothetical protein